MGRDSSLPACPLCTETLGTYGGPTTLPCGHNMCLHCTTYLQQRQPQCPLCRTEFAANLPLAVNCELRELMRMAQALTATTVEGDWQAVTSDAQINPASCKQGGGGASPRAPPAPLGLADVAAGAGSVMELWPQPWEPDSSSATCRAAPCGKPFSFLLRPRHHCRCCGQLFCSACTSERMLLPPRFQLGEPQRVCSACATLLAPIQPLLAGSIAPAVRQPVHDVTDWSAARSLLNLPLSSSLETNIYAATNIVRAARKVGSLPSEASIPPALLRDCAGLAILSVARVGAGWSLGLGSGLVVARTQPGAAAAWSPPSALLSLSSAVGWQLGLEVQDLILVLRSRSALRAFAAAGQLGVGGSVSLAAGPLGRAAAARALATLGGGAVVYSYCATRGAFAGVALEGTLLATRDSLNRQFYGRKVSAHQLLLSDAVAPPPAAAALYAALDELLAAAGEAQQPQFLAAAEGGERAGVALPPPAVAAAAGSNSSEDEEEWEPEVALPSAPTHHSQAALYGSLLPLGRREAFPASAPAYEEDSPPYGSLFD